MREIVFDTETTGFKANDAVNPDRLVEIGCVELIDLLPTGRQFHRFVNPQRDMPPGAYKIHGLSEEFLRKNGQLFKDIIDDFMEFIGDATLIAHNARFDMGFINAELVRAGADPLPQSRFKDTLGMAHAKFPGSPATLDALCKRFDISLSGRDKHGAIIDSELLAGVYLELSGGREHRLGFDGVKSVDSSAVQKPNPAKMRPAPLSPLVTETELEAHKAFVEGLGEKAVWQKVWRKQARG